MTKPDFFIVGAPRCGTTALYSYLQQHPGVFMPYRKEPHYFGADIPPRPPYLDEEGYLALFRPAGQAQRVGEATVWYLYSDSAARQIHDFSPNARIIVMVRRPPDMLYSLHGLLLFATWEDLPDFGQALAAEPDRRAGHRLPRNTWWPKALYYRWLADFAPHLERFYGVFGRERVHVIVYDDFRADPGGVLRNVLRFLDLDDSFAPTLAVVNRARTARSMRLQRLFYSPRFLNALARLGPRGYHYVWRALMRANIRYETRPPMSTDIDRMLTDELVQAVTRLEALLGRSLPSWKRSPGA